MASLIQQAGKHKESAGRDSVREHHEGCAGQSGGSKAENTEHNKSKVADRGVGNQFFQIRLNHRDQRAVDDSDQSQHTDPAGVRASLGGEQAEIEAQHSVSAHLQQYSGEQDRAGRGSLDVSIRKPGVEWKQRNFYSESDEESQK